MIIDLSSLSLVGGSGITEAKIPLWWADGQSYALASNTGNTWGLQDGGSYTYPPGTLFTFSSNWNPNMQVAFEITSALGGGTASLWDETTSAIVSSSSITSSASGTTQITVLRSGKFTLTPSRSYGVRTQGTGNLIIVDASLIIFP